MSRSPVPPGRRGPWLFFEFDPEIEFRQHFDRDTGFDGPWRSLVGVCSSGTFCTMGRKCWSKHKKRGAVAGWIDFSIGLEYYSNMVPLWNLWRKRDGHHYPKKYSRRPL